MENIGEEMESVMEANQKDTKSKVENTLMKSEDLDGLQMLRLAQEDDKTLLRKDMIPEPMDSVEQQISIEDASIEEPPNIDSTVDADSKHEVKCFQIVKPMMRVESHTSHDYKPSEDQKADATTAELETDVDRKPDLLKLGKQKLSLTEGEKHKGADGGVERRPALVKKELCELSTLTERQQKTLQDFHVKFALEGVDVDEDEETRARRHPEFHELKKRLEEEEKMYAGCALGEASDIDVPDKDQIDADLNIVIPELPATSRVPANEPHPSESAREAVSDSLNEVINSLANVAICRPESSPRAFLKPLPGPQNVRNAMKRLADDDGSAELQEYTNREGSIACQCSCQKAGKQTDEEDESDVYMTNSSYSVLNVVCPVSGKPVVDLCDPVRSEECEHIYDRASALNYIASTANDGFCLCASSGCRALLAENKLVTDSRLWQDIEELRQIKAALWESRMLQDFVNLDDSDDD